MNRYRRRMSAAERQRIARRKRMILIGAVALVALAVILTVILVTRRPKDVPAMAPVATVEATAAPVPTDAPTPTPAPTQNPRMANRPAAKEGLLPVFANAQTDEKIIAITVDDCYQAENLRVIVDTALANGARLTIFPIGEVALRDSVSQVLKYAWENGMEIENHTFTHNGLYGSTPEELANEVYGQNLTLSKILGVEYQCHFLRPKGGDAKEDERLHRYIDQLGYYGVAHWNVSGSGSSAKTLAETLAPGNIYLFHTTDDRDFGKLCGFIPYAVEQGYRLVTLNEMFGYPENETKPLEKPVEEYEIPQLKPYIPTMIRLSEGDHDYRVLEMQQRLVQLGYLTDTPDGIFGENTELAVKAFQQNAGLEVTGKADVATQMAMNADIAPRAN